MKQSVRQSLKDMKQEVAWVIDKLGRTVVHQARFVESLELLAGKEVIMNAIGLS